MKKKIWNIFNLNTIEILKKYNWLVLIILLMNSSNFAATEEWLICGNNSWEELKDYLPAAKINGTTIQVNLLPPVQFTSLCNETDYSEPYKQDYIQWANEIAKLSLRYSNLTSFRIEEVEENLRQGYFNNNLIDSIKSVSESINPNLIFVLKNIPPLAPTNLVVNNESVISLTWLDPSDTDLKSIMIYRGLSTSSLSLLSEINPGVQKYTDSEVTDGNTYYYRLKAKDNEGLISEYSNEVSAAVQIAPGVPTNVVASDGNPIKLKWINPDDKDLDSIKIYRSLSKNAATLLTTVSAAAQEYSDVNLNTSETYYYRLKAKDTDGLLSDYSLEVSATEFKIEDPTNNWYVDKYATGNGDGTSWANAATTYF